MSSDLGIRYFSLYLYMYLLASFSKIQWRLNRDLSFNVQQRFGIDIAATTTTTKIETFQFWRTSIVNRAFFLYTPIQIINIWVVQMESIWLKAWWYKNGDILGLNVNRSLLFPFSDCGQRKKTTQNQVGLPFVMCWQFWLNKVWWELIII